MEDDSATKLEMPEKWVPPPPAIGWFVWVGGAGTIAAACELQFCDIARIVNIDRDFLWSTFWSKRLSEIPASASHREVIDIARSQIEVINGAMSLHRRPAGYGLRNPIEIGRNCFHSDEQPGLHIGPQHRLYVGTSYTGYVGEKFEPNHPNLTVPLLRLPVLSGNVQELLHYLTQENTFVNLYKMMELMSSHGDHSRWAENDGVVPRGFIRQFKMAANNYNLSGRQGRHGVLSQEVPSTPGYSLEESTEHMREVAFAWLSKLVT